MGPDEQLYVSSITNPRIIGEGGESVVYRTPGDPFVTKVFRDKPKFAHTARSISDRAASTVLAGEIGIAPPAYRKSERIVRQKHVDLKGASLEDAFRNDDTGALIRVLASLRRYHGKGIFLGDTAASNLLDPARTGGYIAVDATRIGYSGNNGDRYALADLAQTQWEADERGRGDTFLDTVGRVYGSQVKSELSDRRAEDQSRGRFIKLHVQPLDANQLRRAV